MHISSPGKDHNLKSEVWFLPNDYCFNSTIRSKNHKLNDFKSMTFCKSERQILYELSCMWDQEKEKEKEIQAYRYREQIGGCKRHGEGEMSKLLLLV